MSRYAVKCKNQYEMAGMITQLLTWDHVKVQRGVRRDMGSDFDKFPLLIATRRNSHSDNMVVDQIISTDAEKLTAQEFMERLKINNQGPVIPNIGHYSSQLVFGGLQVGCEFVAFSDVKRIYNDLIKGNTTGTEVPNGTSVLCDTPIVMRGLLFELDKLGISLFDDKLNSDDMNWDRYPRLGWDGVEIAGMSTAWLWDHQVSSPEAFLKLFKEWKTGMAPTYDIMGRPVKIYKSGVKVGKIWIPKDDVITIYKVLSIESTNY